MKRVPILLTDPSPCLRLLVLQELLQKPKTDPEINELKLLMDSDPLITDLIKLQEPDGSWRGNALVGSVYNTILTTAMALARFSFLGFEANHPTVQKGVEFLFSQQNEDGSWPLPSDKMGTLQDKSETKEGYDMIPLQTGMPLKSVVTCGYATDHRAELAYKWLLDKQLEDGAWPTGINAGVFGGVAGYRRLAHSRWGCRTNTTVAASCLAYHPKYRTQKAARRALDLLLGQETKEKHTLGFEVARLIGVEPPRGFLTYHARFDVGYILNLCWRIGASLEDERIADIADFILEQQGQYGLWEYHPYPQASRWVTFDLLRSLSNLDDSTDWLSLEPRIPFRAYPKQQRRF